MAIRFLLGLAVAFVGILPMQAAAKDEACTYGVDCLCDRMRSTTGVIFCEDFEDPLLADIGSRRRWSEKYGVGDQNCTPDNTSTALFRVGFYPDPGAISQGKACAAQVQETSCEVSGQADCVFQGRYALGHRMQPGKVQGIIGEAKFRRTRRFGLTMLIKWSRNYMAPQNCSECGPAHKMNEFGSGRHPLMGATLYSGAASANHPFSGGIISTGAPSPSVSLGLLNVPSDLPGFVYFGPDKSRYQWGTTNRLDQWGCFQMHWDGWGTSGTRFRYWFDGQAIINGTMNSSSMYQGHDTDGIASMAWNNYYNGDGYPETGYPSSGTVAYRYEDNVIITDAAEPIPCSSVGFGGSSPPPPAQAPPPPVLLP